MSGRATKHHVVRPGSPAVNILSPAVFEQLAVARLRRRFALGAVVLVLVVIAASYAQHQRGEQARRDVAVQQQETRRLTAETAALTPVRTFVAGVEQQTQTVRDAMAHEVHLSVVLDRLRSAIPPGITIDSLQTVLEPALVRPVGATTSPPGTDPATAAGAPATTVPATALCPGPDPFSTRPVVGCLTLTGSAVSRADVGAFLVALGADDLFVEPFIATTTIADAADAGEAAEVVFNGSVGLSLKAYSQRYARMWQPKPAGGDR